MRLIFLGAELEHHMSVLDEMSTKLDSKIFEQMVRRNGLG